jgi:hypothetical protein
MEQLVEGDPEMRAERPYLLEGDRFFTPDAPVSAVIADVEQFRDLVHQGQVSRDMIPYVPEKKLLNVAVILHDQKGLRFVEKCKIGGDYWQKSPLTLKVQWFLVKNNLMPDLSGRWWENSFFGRICAGKAQNPALFHGISLMVTSSSP